MTSPPPDEKSGTPPADAEERRTPQEVLSAFEDQMKRKVKQFDLRVLQNKRNLEKIRGHLSGYLDDCQKTLERRLAELDAKVDALVDKVEIWEKDLVRRQTLQQGIDT